MIEKVRDYVKQHHMIEAGELVLAGVSGGADSVCLLLLLAELRKELSFTLAVVHVEHGIRGSESLADADFVRELCRRLGLEFYLYPVEAAVYARECGLGLEEAARLLRYRSYAAAAETLRKQGADRVSVALAHHMDDQAETVLFQLNRGSGVFGLCGMLPVRTEGALRIIRPLLSVRRSEIEAYCKEHGQDFRTDATNGDFNYSRNRIRHQILPALAEINAGSVSHIAQTAEYLCGIRDYFLQQAQAAEGTIWQQAGGAVRILIPPFQACHPALAGEILRYAVFLVTQSRKDLTSSHIRACRKLADAQSGKCVMLPYGVEVRREFDALLVQKRTGPAASEETEVPAALLAALFEKKAPAGAPACMEIALSAGALTLYAEKYHGKAEEIAKKTYTKCLDYDMIKNGFVIRTRRPGDYLVIDQAGHRKLLKEYLIEQKIPQSRRDTLLLVACGQEIVWVIGGRISENYKVTGRTSGMVRMVYQGGTEDGT